MQNTINALPENLKRACELASDKGASSWLNAIPLKEQNLDLNKEEFIGVLWLRYDIPLEGLPSNYACGERFSINHAHLAVTKGDLLW